MRWGLVGFVFIALVAPSGVRAADPFEVVMQPGADAGYVEAVRSAATRCIPHHARYLGTVLVRTVTFYVFPTQEAYARGLVEIAGVTATDAQVASRTSGYTNGYRILLNQARQMQSTERQRSEVVCHELVHTYQGALGGQRNLQWQWVREAYAIWLAAAAMEAVGYDRLTAIRLRLNGWITEARDKGERIPRFVDLVGMNAEVLTSQYGRTFTAVQFAGVDLLLRRVSHQAFVQYFSRQPSLDVGTVMDNFQASFGVSLEAFQAEFDVFVQSLR